MSDLPPLDALESMRAFELKAALQAVNLDTEGPRSDLVRVVWLELPEKSNCSSSRCCGRVLAAAWLLCS